MAAKLIITRGLPACGKSTFAEDFRVSYEALGLPCRVVTMDDIRTAIGAKFDDGDESIVQSVRDYTIREYLKKGYTVISADTNLAPHTFARIHGIAEWLCSEGTQVEIDVFDMTDVPLDVCLERNNQRWVRGDCKVPNQAIVKMHEKYLAKA
jgi:predicted kinase